jgi:CDP-glucose 4,6-dehydratase
MIRSDGTPLRDYIYVEDVVASYLAIAHGMDREEVRGEAFNVSNESPRSVRDIANRICDKMGVPFDPVVEDRAHGEIPAQYLDSTKIRDLVGWKGIYDLDAGLDRSIAWYREFLDERSGGPPALRRQQLPE